MFLNIILSSHALFESLKFKHLTEILPSTKPIWNSSYKRGKYIHFHSLESPQQILQYLIITCDVDMNFSNMLAANHPR